LAFAQASSATQLFAVQVAFGPQLLQSPHRRLPRGGT
jgi:hypothetical protein